MDAAAIIRAARAQAGLTLRELAAQAGTSDATLSAYEQGRVAPRVDTVDRIVRAAGWHLVTDLSPVPVRDPRRAPPGEELWQALELASMLPSKPRSRRPKAAHAVFGRP